VQLLRENESHLAVNSIILGEMEYGILLLPKGGRRTRLLQWMEAGVQRLRVHEIDSETAKVWARLLADLAKKGRAMPIEDSLIAATARQHDLSVATRNVGDYQYAGVPLTNPFQN
jgi:predicted nucleic acid-binding protein